MSKSRKQKELSLIEARQVKEKAEMIKHLEKVPIIEVACQKTCIGRSTYYRWLKEDPDFRIGAEKALINGRERLNDMAESVVVKKVSEGDLSASKYYLGHNHPNYHAKSHPPLKKEEMPFIVNLQK